MIIFTESFMGTTVIILMLITLLILIVGLILMVRGGDANRKYSNRMMWARVGVQALAIIGFIIAAKVGM